MLVFGWWQWNASLQATFRNKNTTALGSNVKVAEIEDAGTKPGQNNADLFHLVSSH